MDLPSQEPNPPRVALSRRSRRWLKRLASVLTLLALAMLIARVGLGWYADRQLQAEIQRCRDACEPVFPNDFDPPPVEDEDNAALLLIRAAEALPATADDKDLLRRLTHNPKEIADRQDLVARLVRASAEARALARQARSRSGTDWGFRLRSPVLYITPPDIDGPRKLAKVLAIAAVHHHQAGNSLEALETVRDLLVVARHIDRQPMLISHLVAVAIRSLACNCVETIAPGLHVSGQIGPAEAEAAEPTPAQVQALITELLDEVEGQLALVRGLHSERSMQLDTVQLVLQGKTRSTPPGSGQPQPIAKWSLLRPVFVMDAVRLMRHATAWADAAKQPTWPAVKRRQPPKPIKEQDWQIVPKLLTELFLRDRGRYVTLNFRGLMHQRLAATALAIRLHELDHGRRPATLEQLVPKYLSELPADAFAADGRRIGYKPDANPPVLYSISKDGLDDGGRFGLKPKGGVDWEVADLPFFLDGDRPLAPPTTQATSRQVPPTRAATRH